MSVTTRRRLLVKTALAFAAPWSGCAAHRHNALDDPPLPDEGRPLNGFAGTVYGFGHADAAPVLLLHELPGLNSYAIKLAAALAQTQLRVYLPLLFGKVNQHNTAKGFWQACLRGGFECGTRAVRSPVLDRLETLIDRIATESDGRAIGIVGMCLTGALPLALLRDTVKAAVLCQPTVPFSALRFRPVGAQKSDLGLSPSDIGKAARHTVPFLAMRYVKDPLCPPERFAALEATFPGRMATIVLKDKGHSALAKDHDSRAFDDTVRYLHVRLGVAHTAQAMAVATYGGQPCEITASGEWRALSAGAAQT